MQSLRLGLGGSCNWVVVGFSFVIIVPHESENKFHRRKRGRLHTNLPYSSRINNRPFI